MIESFGSKATEQIFNEIFVRNYPKDIQRKALNKLRMLSAATQLQDMLSSPGNKLRKMKGQYKEFHRINVSDKYRIKFKWHAGNAYEVEFGDDHDEL